MAKLVFFLILLLGVQNLFAQNLFGITRVTTKAGAVIDAPRPDSKHYQIRFPLSEYEVEAKAFCYEYIDGKYKQSDFDKVMHVMIPKATNFMVDFVPELQTNGAFKLYMYSPGVTRYWRMFCDANKCLKFVPYEIREMLPGKSFNALLVYEDEKDGRVERLVSKYLVNGVLKTNSKADKVLYSSLKRYSILSYTIENKMQ